VKILKNSVPLI